MRSPVSEWEPEWEVVEDRNGVVVRRLKPMPEEVKRAEKEKERRGRWYAEVESMKGMKIVMFFPKGGEREFRITRAEALRAIEASVIQILKEKLDRRLEEEFLAPYVCDTAIQHTDDYMEIGTKCLGHAFDLHVHIEYTVTEDSEGCVVVATVVPTKAEGVGE
jgi:hypothetical protein